MSNYTALRSSESLFEDDTVDGLEKTYVASTAHQQTRPRRLMWQSLLTLSLLSNVFFIGFLLVPVEIPESPTLLQSRYAGLKRDIARPWIDFPVADESQQAALWNETTIDRGNIALSDDYAQSMDLPRAQRFPWDRSKGIYLINAYHNLHCVITLREAILEYYSKSNHQSSPHLHVIHCLNVLRDEIMCNADDTPRYTGFQPHKASGLGQTRMCRDWKQLERWAESKTACWRHINDIADPGFRELDRYRFCPEGSPYKETSETKWLHS